MSTGEDVLLQTDWEIIGYIVNGYIGILVNILCLTHFIKSTWNHEKMKASMKYSAYVAFISSLIYCIMTGIFRTNIIFKNFDFNAKEITCGITFGITYFFYVTGKFGVYILFTYRLQIVFIDSPYPVSQKFLFIIRSIIIALTIIYIVGICIFLDRQEILTPIYGIRLCTGNTEFNTDYGDLSFILFVVTDLIISGTLLCLYCYKLYKMSELLSDIDDDNMRYKAMRRLQQQLKKSSILVITAILSAWIIVLIGNYVWWPLGWIGMPLDMTINTISVYLMFGFSKPVYNVLCFVCNLKLTKQANVELMPYELMED